MEELKLWTVGYPTDLCWRKIITERIYTVINHNWKQSSVRLTEDLKHSMSMSRVRQDNKAMKLQRKLTMIFEANVSRRISYQKLILILLSLKCNQELNNRPWHNSRHGRSDKYQAICYTKCLKLHQTSEIVIWLKIQSGKTRNAWNSFVATFFIKYHQSQI